MWKIRKEIDWKEERFRLLSDKVDKNRMADAETGIAIWKDQGKQGDRKRGPSISPGRASMDEEDDDNVGGVVP